MGAMKTTPTAAMEALLNLTPLDTVGMEEARLQHSKQLIFSDVELGLLEFKRFMADDILCMESDHINPVRHYTKNFSHH